MRKQPPTSRVGGTSSVGIILVGGDRVGQSWRRASARRPRRAAAAMFATSGSRAPVASDRSPHATPPTAPVTAATRGDCWQRVLDRYRARRVQNPHAVLAPGDDDVRAGALVERARCVARLVRRADDTLRHQLRLVMVRRDDRRSAVAIGVGDLRIDQHRNATPPGRRDGRRDHVRRHDAFAVVGEHDGIGAGRGLDGSG